MEAVQTGLMVLTLIAAVAAPVIAVLRLRASQKAETERLIAKIEESLGASVKLLEVRNYYEQMRGELKKMLDEAYKEGNRFRQDHLRRLIERLEQLKARTLDRTTRLLETDNAAQQGGGRRHRRRGHRGGQGQNFQNRPQNQGQQQNRPQNQQRPQQGQPPRQQQQQPPRQDPPKQQPPRQEPPRDSNPPQGDPREGPSPSPFEE